MCLVLSRNIGTRILLRELVVTDFKASLSIFRSWLYLVVASIVGAIAIALCRVLRIPSSW